METINEIIAAVEEPPESFEQYLTSYADRVGDLVNSFIPKGTHADMDRYLYQPLMAYSQNGGKRHRPLICFAACRAVGGDMARATSAATSRCPSSTARWCRMRTSTMPRRCASSPSSST